MNELQIFNYHDKNLRVQKTETGEPLWCLADLCKMLDIKNSKDAKKRLDPRWVVTTDLPHPQSKTGKTIKRTFIGEPNFYNLIFQSRKEEAKKFQDWVFSEVLPSIRKTGGYTVDQVKQLELDLKTAQEEIYQKCCQLDDEFTNTSNLQSEIDRLRRETTIYQHRVEELQLEIIANLPPLPAVTRNGLTAKVKDYSDANNFRVISVWACIYDGLKKKFGINIQSTAKEMGCLNLDIIESEGYIQHCLDIIRHWEQQEPKYKLRR